MITILKMVQLVEEHGVASADDDGTIVLKNGMTLVPEVSTSPGCDTCGYGSKTSITWYVRKNETIL